MPLPTRRVLLATLLLAVASSTTAQTNTNINPANRKPPPDVGQPPNSRHPAPDFSQYEYGKEIFAVKIGCETCPLGNMPLDDRAAKKFLYDPSISDGLTDKEREAVTAYLRQLFVL